jgi:ribulose-bisphosphate carboxylase large chain
MRIAYPLDLFDRNITDGRLMIVSFLTLVIGNNQGMGDIEHAKMIDFYMPERASSCSTARPRTSPTCGASSAARSRTAATSPARSSSPSSACAPSRSPRPPTSSGSAATSSRTTNRRATRCLRPMKKVMPLVYDAMKRAQDETGEAKLFSANITADDHYEMCARADFILETFGPDADKVAFLVDGYVGGPGMVTTARRQYPNQYLHYHRAGHGAVTSPSSKRGYTAYVLAKMSRLQGASGIHVGTMGYGKMEGEGDDRAIAYIIERDEYQGPAYFQKWYGMKPTTPIISGGMNALRLPGFFENLGHGNVINTAGGGSYGHIDSPAAGAISLRQAYECWKAGADPIEWAKEHKEFARAFESFPKDADKLYPGWREKLGVHR